MDMLGNYRHEIDEFFTSNSYSHFIRNFLAPPYFFFKFANFLSNNISLLSFLIRYSRSSEFAGLYTLIRFELDRLATADRSDPAHIIYTNCPAFDAKVFSFTIIRYLLISESQYLTYSTKYIIWKVTESLILDVRAPERNSLLLFCYVDHHFRHDLEEMSKI